MLDTRQNIRDYPTWQMAARIERLAEVVQQIASLTEDYYRMQADELRTQSEAWLTSREDTISGRERDVKLATYHVTASILETRAQLESMREERNFLLLLVGGRNGTAI